LFAEKHVPAEFKKAKYVIARYGSFLKLVTYIVVILPCSGIPFASMYLNADPTYHIMKYVFKGLPMIPKILKAIYGTFLPLALLFFRYCVMLPLFYEGFRSLALLLIIVVLSAGQFGDAFDFQAEFFFALIRQKGGQMSCVHVRRYREILVVRNTFGPGMHFGLLAALVGVASSVVWVNYYIIKMYDLLPPAVCFMLVCYVTIAMSSLIIGIKEAAAINETSIELVKQFRRGTILVPSGQRKYLLKVMNSLQAFSFAVGVPGFDFFSISSSTKKHVLQFIVDNTINALLTF
jgi:hypothetical protein